MKKIVFLSLFIITVYNTEAQKRNELVISAEAATPDFKNNLGGGFFIKGLHKIGKASQVTLSMGFAHFQPGNTLLDLTPVLAGYKQNFGNFFVEPQAGLGQLSGQIPIDGDFVRPFVVAFFGAINAGYTIKKFSLGLRFQTAHGIQSERAGIWHDKNFQYESIFVGYRILPGKKK